MVPRIVFGFLLVITVGAGDRLIACGDKYLNLGLGTHYHRSAAERRAAGILLYANAGSELSGLVRTLAVEEAMEKAGYRPTVLGSDDELDTALRKRDWDVIIVDGGETPAALRRLPQDRAPRVVPVLMRPTKDELKQAIKAYEVVIHKPSRTRVFVEAIDEAMDLHEFERAAAARRVKR